MSGLPKQFHAALECRLDKGNEWLLHTSMSGRGSSQDCVYRKVGGNIGGASTRFSSRTVASCGTCPIQT